MDDALRLPRAHVRDPRSGARAAFDESNMKKAAPITCLFLDIGGVLLTDGWNHHARGRAATTFALDCAAMEERHRRVFDGYERGEMTLEEYLDLVVFHEERPFTRAQFRSFMFAQSKPFPDVIALFARLKVRHRLKVVVVSNEARELNAYRIKTFALPRLVDAFVSSCFVHLRKPDAEIFRLALDIAQTPPDRVLYVENTSMYVEIAARLGIRGVLHTDCQSTRASLGRFGLHDDGLES
jgi:putative hydrolase of the HAD superfamily